MSKKKDSQQFQVSVEHEGIRYLGHYTVDGKVITVFYQGRHTSTNATGSAVLPTAKMVLRQLIAASND